MCGVCGYISYNQGIKEKEPILKEMCDLITHRGPDDSGIYLNQNVGLGHRRLSIIDLSSGHQPLSDEEKKIWVVFNGEIYNFPEIKKELQAKGHPFATNSDTEVIIQGYKAYGTKILEKLNGMFVFALWDENNKSLFIAKDRMGKKPLYFYPGKNQFLFSSELKSILAEPEVPREINPEAIDKFFSYNYIPSPLTIFKGISKLRPGHYLTWEDKKIDIQQYWDVRYQENTSLKTEEDYVENLNEILQAAVKRRLISDVPLGAFLSGGIDSSLMVAFMSQISTEPVKTFTIGFDNQKYSEVPDARLVAEKFKTDHHEYTVESKSVVDLLPKLVWHFDEPFADSSAVPTYYVSEIARREVTVILSGDGGDELFAGYSRYLRSENFEKYKTIPKALRKNIIGPIAKKLPLQTKGKFFLMELGELDSEDSFEMYPPIKSQIFSSELCEKLENYDPSTSSISYWGNIPTHSRISKMQYLDTKLYLPEDILVKVDKMSMANSLETRAPLLDYTVAEFAATIPDQLQMKDGKGKYILRSLASRFLPSQIMNKKKQGFAIPKDEWFKKELKDYSLDMLTSKKFKERGYFNSKAVEEVLHEHIKGHRDYSVWIWSLLNLELWHQTFTDSDTKRI